MMFSVIGESTSAIPQKQVSAKRSSGSTINDSAKRPTMI